jgi:uncharacterized protein
MSDIIGSGLSFPIGVDHHGAIGLARGEQDIEQAIKIVLGTAPGERQMRPEFGCGIHDFIFDTIDAELIGNMDHAIRAAIDRWEPRIEITNIDFDLARMGDGMLEIELTYMVLATSRQYNLVYPFYVIPAEEFE